MKTNLKKEHKQLIKKAQVIICQNCKKEITDGQQLRGTIWKENGETQSEYHHTKKCYK